MAMLSARVQLIIRGMSRLHRRNLLVTAKAYDNAEHPNSSTSQPKSDDTTPPTAPVVTSDLTGKATTTDPVEVTTDPNTKVELLTKMAMLSVQVQPIIRACHDYTDKTYS